MTVAVLIGRGIFDPYRVKTSGEPALFRDLGGQSELEVMHSGPSFTVGGTVLWSNGRAEGITVLGHLYQLCQHRACRFARRLIGDDAAAEDLLHDVFLHMPRLLGRYRGDAPFEVFLLGVLSRRARRHLRSAIRKRKLHDRFVQDANAVPPTPEWDTGRHELAAMLVRALDTLSREQRLAFVLREVEGLSAAEAAQVAGVSEATIRTRVFHARRRLQAELGRLQVVP